MDASPCSMSKGFGDNFSAFNCMDLFNRVWLGGKFLKPSISHTCQCIGKLYHIHVILLAKHTTCVVPLAKHHLS